MVLGLRSAAMELLLLGEASEAFPLKVVQQASTILRTKIGMDAVQSGFSIHALVEQLASALPNRDATIC